MAASSQQQPHRASPVGVLVTVEAHDRALVKDLVTRPAQGSRQLWAPPGLARFVETGDVDGRGGCRQ